MSSVATGGRFARLLNEKSARTSSFALATTVSVIGAYPAGVAVSVQLRSASGVLGTIELGNTVPRDGSDTEFKIAGREAILILYHDDTMRLITSAGDEVVAAAPAQPLYFTCVREILDRWRRGERPRVTAADLVPVVRLIDQAYARARD